MSSQPSERTRVKRLPERGVYDTDKIHAVLDEAPICHVGFIAEHGPVVIPTIHARVDDTLYLHGSPASAMLRSTPGEQVCITVTILDGLVVARSAFHHSMNYRSVVVFGEPRIVDDPAERMVALEAITNHVIPGRWDEARQPNDKEDRGTKLLAVSLDEASMKTRSGPPGDDDEDMDLDIWAGIIPMALTAGPPITAPDLKEGVPVPPSVQNYGAQATAES